MLFREDLVEHVFLARSIVFLMKRIPIEVNGYDTSSLSVEGIRKPFDCKERKKPSLQENSRKFLLGN
jgi:hypothetical protein